VPPGAFRASRQGRAVLREPHRGLRDARQNQGERQRRDEVHRERSQGEVGRRVRQDRCGSGAWAGVRREPLKGDESRELREPEGADAQR
jgi:hypothetical protein